jgi:hypothetical protein
MAQFAVVVLHPVSLGFLKFFQRDPRSAGSFIAQRLQLHRVNHFDRRALKMSMPLFTDNKRRNAAFAGLFDLIRPTRCRYDARRGG